MPGPRPKETALDNFMAFRFKRKESVQKAVQRIALKRIGCALRNLGSADKVEAVHRVRMEIKKLRGLLRLVREASGEAWYTRQTGLLREAANSLGSVRDAHVTAKALSDLISHYRAQLSRRPFNPLKQALQARCREAVAGFEKESRSKLVAKNLRQVQRECQGLRLHAKGWTALCAGLTWSYSRGRRSKAACLKDPSPENLHEWRKRVKDLWYQVRLLRPVWPEQMCAMASELKTLSDLLGDDHDLVILRGVLEQIHPAPDELEAVCALINQRQEELRSAGLALGARFYSEKTAAFINRLGRYWSVWRSPKGKLKRKARASLAA